MNKLTQTFEEIIERNTYSAGEESIPTLITDDAIAELINAVREYNKQVVGEDEHYKAELLVGADEVVKKVIKSKIRNQNELRYEIRQRQEELIGSSPKSFKEVWEKKRMKT